MLPERQNKIMRHDEDNDICYCPVCGGPGVELGRLGNRAHYRCRNCGIDFSHEVDDHSDGIDALASAAEDAVRNGLVK